MNRTVNAAMVVLARESSGLTQLALAKLLGITQGKLSKMESGQIPVTSDVLAALVHELDYPEKFYYQTFEVYPAGMHLYLFRKHKTMPARDLSRITALMNIYRSHIRNLLDAAEIDFKPVPEYEVEEFDSVATIAHAVRQYAHIPSGPIKNLTETLEDLGIVVVPFDPGTRMFAGASMLSEKPNYVVLINSQMPGDRFRWTLAHELAHMVMHRFPTLDMEGQANDFAAEFLMPGNEIGQYLSDLTLERLASLKRYWGVSMFSILQHALRLGKITERHHRTLIGRLARAGVTRLREPAELSIPVEVPSLLNELIDFHATELGYDADQLSDLLAIKPTTFLDRYRFKGRRLKLVQNVG